ncbi:MAG: decaprenyl-phosphate phosphoribosyltransferase [Planctomycetota bacterium]
MELIYQIVRIARPEHWIKNLVVFAPIVFSKRVFDIHAWFGAGAAALACCFASSFSYIFNDIRDVEADRLHPLKKNRPLASGQISVKSSGISALVILLLGFISAYSVSLLLFSIIVVFVALQISYSLLLKHISLLDVMVIALGFVLRAGAGVVAIRGEISPWLFICIFTICLFMGFCKRYNEVVTLGDNLDATNHRPILIEYTPELLTHLITLSAGIAIISYLLYGLSDSTIERFGSNYFIYTLPIVVYAVFRFAMISMKGTYSDPTDLILHDRPFQITSLIWLVTAVAIIFWGSEFKTLLSNFY